MNVSPPPVMRERRVGSRRADLELGEAGALIDNVVDVGRVAAAARADRRVMVRLVYYFRTAADGTGRCGASASILLRTLPYSG